MQNPRVVTDRFTQAEIRIKIRLLSMDEHQVHGATPSTNGNSAKTILIALAVVIVVVAGAFLFINRHTLKPVSKNVAVQNTKPKVTLTITSVPEYTFVVTGTNYSFDPSTITVKKGDKLKILFKSTKGIHDWNLDEFNAHTKKIKTGSQDTVEFTASTAGKFTYYSSVGSDKAQGMKGTLVVQ